MVLEKLKEKIVLDPSKSGHYMQKVPEVHKAPLPASTAGSTLADIGKTAPLSDVVPLEPGTSVFPTETVLYRESFRDIVISNLYDETLIRPVPLLYLAIGFTSVRVSKKGANPDENAVLPITLHRGVDKTGPVLGYVENLERDAKGTLLNSAYDPDAQFKTTILDINAHLTRQFCEFKLSVPSRANPAVRSEEVFRWIQCEGHPAVLSLCADRPVPSHDWCMLDRKNERGMCLFRLSSKEVADELAAPEIKVSKLWGFGSSKPKKAKIEDGEVLAVFVAAKSHSRFNPVKMSARIRWMDNEIWSEELKLAAFLAVMTQGEKRYVF